jgi:hypothetical protein
MKVGEDTPTLLWYTEIIVSASTTAGPESTMNDTPFFVSYPIYARYPSRSLARFPSVNLIWIKQNVFWQYSLYSPSGYSPVLVMKMLVVTSLYMKFVGWNLQGWFIFSLIFFFSVEEEALSQVVGYSKISSSISSQLSCFSKSLSHNYYIISSKSACKISSSKSQVSSCFKVMSSHLSNKICSSNSYLQN